MAADHIATFSIVARDPTTGGLGVGVQCKSFGAGGVVPHARADVVALATQAPRRRSGMSRAVTYTYDWILMRNSVFRPA